MFKFKWISRLSALTLFFLTPLSFAQGLFQSTEALHFQLKANFKELHAHRVPPNLEVESPLKDFSVPGELQFQDPVKGMLKMTVEVQLRGNTSQKETECPFPKLKIKIKNSQANGTLFEGQKEVGIGTHCGTGGGNSPKLRRDWSGKSPHREVVVYQMLKILGIETYQVRAAFGTYIEATTGEVLGERMQAFFLEDMGHLKERLQASAEIHAIDEQGPRKINKENGPRSHVYAFHNQREAPQVPIKMVAKIFLFQALIENGDWKIRLRPDENLSRGLWNVKMVELKNGNWIPIPYDFDLSGVVNTLGSDSVLPLVKERLSWKLQQSAYYEILSKQNELRRLVDSALVEDPEGRRAFKSRMDQFVQEFGPSQDQYRH